MSAMNSEKALKDLFERTAFESWFLEALYRIDKPPENLNTSLILQRDGRSQYTVFGRCDSGIGDWRPGFLTSGPPLVFGLAFKLLDMIIEWTICRNGLPVKYQFSEKLKQLLAGSVKFPQLVESRPWFRERLIGLYKFSEPLRSTIIHHRQFLSDSGDLVVQSTKNDTLGEPVHVSAHTISQMSVILVSLVKFIAESWPFGLIEEKLLRWRLDQIANLHGFPLLGQLPPLRTIAEIHREASDPLEIDLASIRLEFAKTVDAIFDLRVVTEDSCYYIPYTGLIGDTLRLTEPDRQKYEVPRAVA